MGPTSYSCCLLVHGEHEFMINGMLCSLPPRASPAALAVCKHYSMAVTLSGDTYNTLQDYHPPSWAQHIKPQPSQYVQVDLDSYSPILADPRHVDPN